MTERPDVIVEPQTEGPDVEIHRCPAPDCPAEWWYGLLADTDECRADAAKAYEQHLYGWHSEEAPELHPADSEA